MKSVILWPRPWSWSWLWSVVAFLFSMDAGALELESIDRQLKTQGFESNLKRMVSGKDNSYEAWKLFGPTKWPAVRVSVFTQGDRVKQVRFWGINCTFSEISDGDMFAAHLGELKKAFRPIFGVDLSKSLESGIAAKVGTPEAKEKGFRKVRVSTADAYCDATRGGTTISVDLFPESQTRR